MGLESTVSGVLSLNEAWPIHDTDPASESYAQVQNIKKGLIGSFPNVSSEVSASSGEFNHLVGLTAHPQTQLDTLSASADALTVDIGNRKQAMSLSAATQWQTLSAPFSTQIHDLSATLNARELTMSAALQAQLHTMSAGVSTTIHTMSAQIDTQIATMQSDVGGDIDTMSANVNAQIQAWSATMDTNIESLSATLNTSLLGAGVTATAMDSWGEVAKFIQTATPTVGVETGDLWFELEEN